MGDHDMTNESGGEARSADEAVSGDLAAARAELRRLLGQADAAAVAMGVEADEIRRATESTVAAARAEVDELRVAMVERLEAADQRFGTAERVVATSRRRLAEIDDLHRDAEAALARSIDEAAALLAQVEIEAERIRGQARQEAAAVIRRAQDDARRTIDEAGAYQREVEMRAADTLGSVQLQVERQIRAGTESRHAAVEDLAAREEQIKQRIEVLLADGIDIASLAITPPRRADRTDPPMIDLTDGVSDAIRTVIDDWTARRTTG